MAKAKEESGKTAVEAASGRPVTVSQWGGMANYECNLCAYATLDAEAMAGHLRAAHGWTETAVGGQSPEGSGGEKDAEGEGQAVG